MKAKYSLIIAGASLIIGLSSCKKYLDVNQNPNASSTSTANLQLPTSELYIGNAIGDRLFHQTSFWAQYYTGGPGVSLGDFDKNTMSTADANQVWNNLYRSNSNFDYIITKTNEPYYIAVAELLSAYNFQVIADLFGDAPYTEALKGDISDGLVLSPTYSSAKDVIYPDLERRINKALAILATDNATAAKPGENELVYPYSGGDFADWRAQWTRFANSLLLKIYMRTGNGAKVSQLYTAAAGEFILTNADNAMISYPGGAQSSNPLWNDLKSSIGNYFVGTKTSIDVLKGSSDPRIDALYDPNNANQHVGLKQGDVENSPSTADYSRPNGAKATGGGTIFSPSAPVMLISSWEVNLLIAEAAARGYISANPATFYNAAVQENADYLGVASADVATYLAGPGAFNSANKIKSIAIQKWICMNGIQPVESWIETRRFDSPATPIFQSPGGIFQVPTQNVLGGANFPSIMLYPATEQDLNKNFPGQHTLTDKVFWDK